MGRPERPRGGKEQVVGKLVAPEKLSDWWDNRFSGEDRKKTAKGKSQSQSEQEHAAEKADQHMRAQGAKQKRRRRMGATTEADKRKRHADVKAMRQGRFDDDEWEGDPDIQAMNPKGSAERKKALQKWRMRQ